MTDCIASARHILFSQQAQKELWKEVMPASTPDAAKPSTPDAAKPSTLVSLTDHEGGDYSI